MICVPVQNSGGASVNMHDVSRSTNEAVKDSEALLEQDASLRGLITSGLTAYCRAAAFRSGMRIRVGMRPTVLVKGGIDIEINSLFSWKSVIRYGFTLAMVLDRSQNADDEETEILDGTNAVRVHDRDWDIEVKVVRFVR